MAVDIRQLLFTTVEMNASDLHIVTGEPPVVRVRGEIRRLNMPALSRSEARLIGRFYPNRSTTSPICGRTLCGFLLLSSRQSSLSCQHLHAIERSQYSAASYSPHCSHIKRSECATCLRNDRWIQTGSRFGHRSNRFW